MSMIEGLRLTYIGGPTILIEIAGLRLLTDPTFDPGGREYVSGPITIVKTMGPAVPSSSIGSIDAVLLSHDHHNDNFDKEGHHVAAAARLVITTPIGAERLGDGAVGLAPWQSHTLQAPDGRKLRVTGTPTKHGAALDIGPVTGFLLAFEDEPEDAVYISGDTVWFGGVAEVIRRYPTISVAILFLGAAHVEPIPAHLTFTAQEAVRVAEALPEARIVPVHFEGWQHLTETQSEIAAAFASASIEDRLEWLSQGQPSSLGGGNALANNKRGHNVQR